MNEASPKSYESWLTSGKEAGFDHFVKKKIFCKAILSILKYIKNTLSYIKNYSLQLLKNIIKLYRKLPKHVRRQILTSFINACVWISVSLTATYLTYSINSNKLFKKPFSTLASASTVNQVSFPDSVAIASSKYKTRRILILSEIWKFSVLIAQRIIIRIFNI